MGNSWLERSRIGLLRTLNFAEHKVRVYDNRLAIWRIDGQRMTWEELQDIKQQVWGDVLAIEIYPPAKAVINLRHTRHLWHTSDLQDIIAEECIHPEFYHG